MMDDEKITACPKCGSKIGEVEETPTGRKLRRCTQGSWNSETRQVEGCPFIEWVREEPQELEEKCPQCNSNLILTTTRFGKRMKKCSQGGWDKEAKKATGCPYVEWIDTSTNEIDENCPNCGEKLVLFTTAKGKKLKKCSTQGWDRESKQVTGCPYTHWLAPNEYAQYSTKTGEEGPLPKDTKTPF